MVVVVVVVVVVGGYDNVSFSPQSVCVQISW